MEKESSEKTHPKMEMNLIENTRQPKIYSNLTALAPEKLPRRYRTGEVNDNEMTSRVQYYCKGDEGEKKHTGKGQGKDGLKLSGRCNHNCRFNFRRHNVLRIAQFLYPDQLG